MKFAVIYARYSSYGQTEQSIEGQVRECKEYAAQNGITIVDTYIDRAMTGTNDNRAAFQQMIKDSVKRAWDTVLVYKLDRFSRNKYEMAIHRKALRDNGVKLVSVKENIPDSPEGIILESLLEGMAEYYSVELAQKVMRGQHETRLKGNYCGGGIPYGYRVEKIDGSKKYVVNEKEAAIIRRIFEEYAAGKIARHIIDGLARDGIYGRDGKPFGKTAIYNILQNERYIGIYRHKTDGVFLDTFPPIVPRKLFETVRSICKINNAGGHRAKEPYLLRGKLYCGTCGANMRGDSGTSMTGKVRKYYACSGRKRLKDKCPKQIVRKEDLEEFVVEVTLKALDSSESINRLADKICEINKARVQSQTTLKILCKEKEEIEANLNNLAQAIEQGIITQTTKSRLEKLEKRLEEVKKNIELEEKKEPVQITKDEVIRFLSKAIRKEPAQLIQMLIHKVVVYDDKIEIFYNTFDPNGPGEDSPHQVFCFFQDTMRYEYTPWNCRGGEIFTLPTACFI